VAYVLARSRAAPAAMPGGAVATARRRPAAAPAGLEANVSPPLPGQPDHIPVLWRHGRCLERVSFAVSSRGGGGPPCAPMAPGQHGLFVLRM
jgi:hypothetical protein